MTIQAIPECIDSRAAASLIERLEQTGFQAMAGLYPAAYRNNDRVILDDPALSASLFKRLAPFLPAEAVSLNTRFRGCRYENGQSFCTHQDGPWVTEDLCSRMTVMLYLNEDFSGGDTVFFTGRDGSETRRIKPRAGQALIFDHVLWHSGEPVVEGRKYVLRTDVMFPKQGQAGYIWGMAVADKKAAFSGRDGRVIVWKEGQAQAVWGGPSGSIGPIVWYKNQLIGGDRQGRLWWWPEKTPIQAHQGAVTGLAMVGDTLLSGGADGYVRCWKGTTLTGEGRIAVGWVLGISGRVVATLEGLVLLDKKLELLWRQPGCWRSVAVGALIAAGSNAGMIMLFLEDGTQIAAWKAHTGPVLSLAWGPGGLLSGGEDGAVKLWNHEKLEEEWRMGNFVTATGWIGDKPGWGGYSGAYVAGKAIREVV